MLSPELNFWLNVGFKNLNLLVILHCLMEEEICPVGLHNVGDYQKTDMSFLWNYSLKRGVDYTRHISYGAFHLAFMDY